jgi:hypothetical protein
MDIGVFIPINNNGWLISENAPQYMPSFELNKNVVQKAEAYGMDFALSMIKLHGFGGKTEFWDHGLESFTLMAGLAAVTKRIKLFASTAVLTIPPAIVARISSPAGTRLNIPRWGYGLAMNISASATNTAPNMCKSCGSFGKRAKVTSREAFSRWIIASFPPCRPSRSKS